MENENIRIVFSYERKKNDINGNPRHYIYNVTEITKDKEKTLIDKIDVGYRDKIQAIKEELKKIGYNKAIKKFIEV